MAKNYYRQSPDTKTIVLVIAVVVFLAASAYEYKVLQERDVAIAALGTELDTIHQVLNTTQAALANAHSENDALKTDVTSKAETINALGAQLGLAQMEIADLTPTIKRFAVVGVGGDGRGVVIPLEVKLVGGTGTISVNIKNVDLQTGVQASVRTAADVAQSFTHTSLASKDLTVSFINKESAIVTIDGGSAGGAITTTIIAALQNKTMRSDVLMTGTITAGGTIGQVGGVSAKATAAKEYGAGIFIVPTGELVTVPGLNVVEIKNIDEAVGILVR